MTIFVLSVFNQKTLYNAYKKRTKNVQVDVEEYNKMKDADPEFYRDASSLQYGKVSCFLKLQQYIFLSYFGSLTFMSSIG